MKIHPVGTELFRWDRRTDGRIMVKLPVVYRNFANAPKTENCRRTGMQNWRCRDNTASPDSVQRSHQSRRLTNPTVTVTESRLMDHKIIFVYLVCRVSEGARVGAVGWSIALRAGRSRVRFAMVSLKFFIDYGPGVDSASNRNEYQEYFLRGKGGWCVRLKTLPPSCADCLEIWNPQGLSRPVMGMLFLIYLFLPLG
jgi:hypothetical protein